MALNLAASILFLAGNFFFVAVEFSIARARPSQVEELVEGGYRGARAYEHAVDNIDTYLSGCQLGITVSSIGLGVFGKPLFEELLEPLFDPVSVWLGISATALAFGFAFAIVSMFHVVLGELAPKSLAIARTVRTGLFLMPTMRVFYTASKPVTDSLNWLGNLVLRPFGIPPASEVGHAPHSEDELREIIRESHEAGVIEPEELEFSHNVFVFGDLRAGEIMIPRPNVAFLTRFQDLRSSASAFGSSGHSRLLLCEPHGGIDAVVGVVHAKDLLALLVNDQSRDLTTIARPVRRVPESMLIDDLLEELRREWEQIALVVDERGRTAGIVTLEDIIEQIVGDIHDEFDRQKTGAARGSDS